MSKSGWVTRACGVFLLWALTAVALPAQTFTTLYSFRGADGGAPWGLVQATDGYLYGTTSGGGANDGGTFFKVIAPGTVRTLYSFCSYFSCMDGAGPTGTIIQDGSFYGTTQFGGLYGGGTVFTINQNGMLTTLHNFNGVDGAGPQAGLVQAGLTRQTGLLPAAVGGSLYGTTQFGGAYGGGTVFTITLTGALTGLHSFNGTDGEFPYAALAQGADGNFYGTTLAGGANGAGTVFKITPSGTLTTLYSFCFQSNCTDGSKPYSGLARGGDGGFVGTTFYGGANGYGTVFAITPDGALTTLHSFDGTGSHPVGGLVLATDGNFYGTTSLGGNTGYNGSIFAITAGGVTTLYGFCSQLGCPDGQEPQAALIQATDGNLYGTTSAGGVNGDGTLFTLSVGLGPFVEIQPASGKVGAPIKILGTNLTGATKVTFHSTPATFTVVSSSLITATVPTGATTGTVKVLTPGGTLSSNVRFRVRP